MKILLTLIYIFSLSAIAQERDPFKKTPKSKEKGEIVKAYAKSPVMEVVGLMVSDKGILAAVKMSGKTVYLKKGSLVSGTDSSVWKVTKISDGQLVLENEDSKKLMVYR
jgi:Tfp pilus assembly protein PilP